MSDISQHSDSHIRYSASTLGDDHRSYFAPDLHGMLGPPRNASTSQSIAENDVPVELNEAPEPRGSERMQHAPTTPWVLFAIDLGTTFSKVAYSDSATLAVKEVTSWPGSHEPASSIPTCLVYDASGVVQAWGVEAKNMALPKDWVRREWYVCSEFVMHT